MKEQEINDRFTIKRLVGEGSFSKACAIMNRYNL